MRQIIKLCNEIAGEIKERRERMMMKRMWYELNIISDEYPSDHSLCRCLWRTDRRNDLSDA